MSNREADTKKRHGEISPDAIQKLKKSHKSPIYEIEVEELNEETFELTGNTLVAYFRRPKLVENERAENFLMDKKLAQHKKFIFTSCFVAGDERAKPEYMEGLYYESMQEQLAKELKPSEATSKKY